MKFVLTIMIFLIALLSSCREDPERSWVGIEETQCANAWDNIGLGSTEDNVTEYLKKNGIRIYDFTVEVYSYGPFCMACYCTSGRTIQVLIDNSDIVRIKELGFE